MFEQYKNLIGIKNNPYILQGAHSGNSAFGIKNVIPPYFSSFKIIQAI